MMNIIAPGKPELRKRFCQCGHCGCQFQYTDDEVYKNEGSNETVYGSVKCPWCLENIRIDKLTRQFSPIIEDAKRMVDKYAQK